MKKYQSYLILFLLPMALLMLVPGARAEMTSNDKLLLAVVEGNLPDTDVQQQPVKQDKKQDKKKKVTKKPDVKEVPKSKRQQKPAPVKVKVKTPVKKIKPVIKKPAVRIKKKL